MSIKSHIIQLLRTEKTVPLTALDQLLEQYTSVSNAQSLLKELAESGYEITYDSNNCVSLVSLPDKLYPELVIHDLPVSIVGKKLVHYDLIGSTNDSALEIARRGYQQGTVVVAEQQQQGRGRHARKWESRAGKSILCSVIFKPDGLHPNETFPFTMLAAVSVVQAINEVLFFSCLIKWPNDVYLNGKKICGILTEFGTKNKNSEYVITGIGINVNQLPNEFSPEISNASSLYSISGIPVDRLALFRKLLIKLDENYCLYLRGEINLIFSLWMEYCNSLGKKIRFVSGNRSGIGTIMDISPNGALRINCEHGGNIEVVSGDIEFVEGWRP
ncbi:biotin--[acetyl-CoA-carboxylase] ligase [bacterium]|nr:biotin--[acetyl-CoA-carboxylase] ligase [bacterium]MCP5462700.1 biotin--[acetyl-CoA-carboxylase] ligase [bacterium]